MKNNYSIKSSFFNCTWLLKKIILFLFIGISNVINAQCTVATNGLYPPATITPTCTGSNQSIVADAWAGEYSNVNIIANRQYTFTSSVATDFITIANQDGTTAFSSGTSPLVWNSGTNTGVIRYYFHTNSSCGEQQVDRTRFISCTTAPIPCLEPSNLNVMNVLDASAQINWNAPSTAPTIGYDIYFSTINTVSPATIPTETITGLTGSLGGLTLGSTYYFWVRSNCGSANVSNWIAGPSFTATVGCLTAPSGLYPPETFTPSCTGSNESITLAAWAGEYSNVNILANTVYTFTSSVASDFVTISNEDGTFIYASGNSPFVWNSGTNSGVIRYFLHTNSSCGIQSVDRTRSISCPNGTIPCAEPTNLIVSNVFTTDVQFDWNEAFPVPFLGYDVYFSTTNAVSPTTVPNGTISDNFAFLGDLNPNTTYYFWVRSNCGDGNVSSWVAGPSFTTLPQVGVGCISAPFGFYPDLVFTPTCTNTNQTIVTDGWAGEYSVVDAIANKQYTFTSSVATDFITIANENATLIYASGISPLIWNSGTNSGFIRYYLHTNSSCGTLNTDRTRFIKCQDAPIICNAPSNLSVTNVFTTNAQINWNGTSPAPSLGYDVYLSTINSVSAATVPIGTLTGLTGQFNNLIPATTYYFWVRSDCGSSNVSNWITGPSFTTLPQVGTGCITSSNGLFPAENFTPTCSGSSETITLEAWAGEYSKINITTNKQYIFTSSVASDFITISNENATVIYTSGASPLTWNSGTNSGVVRYYLHTNSSCGEQNTNRTRSITCSQAVVCNPPTNLSFSNITSTQAQVTWNAASPAPQGYNVYFSTTNSVSPASVPNGVVTGTTALMNNLTATTTYFVWVRSTCSGSVNGTWVSAGNFTTLAQPCNPPSNFSYQNISPIFAQIIWSDAIPEPSAYQVYYSAVNNVSSSSQPNAIINGALGNMNGLSPSTLYYVWVRSFCGGAIASNWVSAGSFTTLPYTGVGCITSPYGLFPVANFIPNCTGQTETIITNAYAGEYSTLDIIQNNQYTFSSSVTTDYITIMAPSPVQIEVLAHGPSPLIWNSGSFTGNVKYLLHTSSDCGAENIHRIKYISCSPTPQCNPPTNLSFSNITNMQGQVNWSAATPSPLGYDVYYSTTNTVSPTSVPNGVVSGTTATLSNLTASTIYYVWVRSVCSGSINGDWISAGGFTTTVTIVCNSPSNLTVSNLFTTSAQLNWNAAIPTPINGYDYYFSTTNSILPTTVPSGTVTSGLLANLGVLTPTTTYYFWVRSNCGSSIGSWIAGPSFTTTTPTGIGCITASYGLFPVGTFTPDCTLSSQSITNVAYAGEYSKVNVLGNTQYTFTSSVTADFITISNENATVIYASGTSPLVWNSGINSGVIRYYTHTNSSCGEQNISRFRYISCSSNPPCNPPTNFSFSNITQSGGQINWTAASPTPQGYDVYYSITNIVSPTSTPNGVVTGTTTVLSGLSASITYNVWVRSTCSGSINGVWVFAGSFTTLSSPCNPPSNLTVSNVFTTSAQLNWNAAVPAPISGYDYYLSTTNSISPTTFPSGTVATGLLITVGTLTPSSTYYFWVRSNCGLSGADDWVAGPSFTTATPTGIGCVTASYGLWPSATFTPTCSGSNETIVSNAYAGEYSNVNIVANTQYTLTSSVSTDFITISNENATIIFASGTSPLAWNSGLNSGVIRYFIHTNSSCGEQGTNRTKSISCTSTVVCNPPTNLSFSNITQTTAQVTWTAASPTPQGYDVYYSTTNSVSPTSTPNGVVTGTTGAMSSLAASTTYFAWVRSICAGSVNGTWVSAGSFTTLAIPCNPPTALNFSNITQTSAQVMWTAATPTPQGYDVYYSTTNTVSPTSTPNGVVTGTTGAMSSLMASTTYFVWVRSTCSGSVLGDWVSAGSFTTLAIPCNPPTNLSFSNITQTTAQVMWTAATPTPLGHDVYFSTINTVSPTSTPNGVITGTTGSMNGLTAFTTYFVWVRSTCSGSVNGTWVSAGSFTTLALPCNPPTNLSITNITQTSAQVNWTAATPTPLGYDVYYSTTNTVLPTSTPNGVVTGTIGAMSSLTASTTYFAWVRSTCSGSVNGDWVSAGSFTTLAIPCNPPTALSISNITQTSAQVNWTAASPTPLGYDVYYSTNNTVSPTSTPNGVVTGTTGAMSSLAASTTYFAWVRSTCSGSVNGTWVSAGSFTTLAIPCNPPTSLSITNITQTSAQVNWTAAMPTPLGYDVYYSTIYDVQPTSIPNASVTGTTTMISNLTPSTDYFVFVRSACSGSVVGNWILEGSFTTLDVVCNPPSNFNFSNITQTTAQVNWTAAIPEPLGYDVFFNTINSAAPTSVPNGIVTGTTGAMSSLTASTTYFIFVRSTCPFSTNGGWVLAGSFTTLPPSGTGCNIATYGQLPSEIFTPSCTDSNETIVANAFAGQYSKVTVLSNTTYTFSSSVATDYITITNEDASVIFGSGVSPFVWNSNDNSGVVSYFIHTNSDCGEENVERIKYITCPTDLDTPNFENIFVKVYPNPTKDILNIVSNEAFDKIIILNSLGQKINELTSNLPHTQINIGNYASGIYFIKVFKDTKNKTFKIVKE